VQHILHVRDYFTPVRKGHENRKLSQYEHFLFPGTQNAPLRKTKNYVRKSKNVYFIVNEMFTLLEAQNTSHDFRTGSFHAAQQQAA
jgi:hypothetical protein